MSDEPKAPPPDRDLGMSGSGWVDPISLDPILRPRRHPMTEPYTAEEARAHAERLESAMPKVPNRLAATLREYQRVVKENAELRDDKERLDRFEATPSNLLVHAWDDGTHGFLWRPSSLVPWPRPSEAPWQDLRTAFDYPYDAARAAGEG